MTIKCSVQHREHLTMERQPMGWEKILTNQIADKDLIPLMYRNSFNSMAKNQIT